jgi:hypothetical protein
MYRLAKLMAKNLNFFFQRMNSYKVIILFSLSLLLTLAPVAIAGYTPPPNQEPPGDYSKSTGIRGCPTITVLAPKTHVGQTVSLHPTFVWSLADADEQDSRFSASTEFRLFELASNGQVKQIGNPLEIKNSPGIMKLSSQEQLTLTVGQKYLWQVAVRCPDGDVIQRAEFRVAEIPSSLKQTLSTTEDKAKKANFYAQAGFWYDAIGEALTMAESGKLGQVGFNLIQSLVQVEETNASNNLRDLEEIQQQVARLKQIANRDR